MRKRTARNTIILNEQEKVLFEALKDWRLKQSRRENVPAYVISLNDTLELIAKHKPATIIDLLSIKGVGKITIEKYGNDILRIIDENSSNKIVEEHEEEQLSEEIDSTKETSEPKEKRDIEEIKQMVMSMETQLDSLKESIHAILHYLDDLDT